MKYNQEITIDLPPEQLFDVLTDESRLHKWQPQLIQIEHLIGTPGEVGSKSRLRYIVKKREVQIVQTLTAKERPHLLTFTYEANYIWNQGINRLEKANGGRSTRFVNENVIRFSGLAVIVGWMMKGAMKRQGMEYLHNLKAYAESLSGTDAIPKPE